MSEPSREPEVSPRTPRRFLFVVPPLVGHVNPTVGVAAELTARGHQVAWAGMPEVVERLTGRGTAVHRCAGPVLGEGGAGRPPDVRGPAALKFLWERFLVPLAEAMAPGVARAIGEFRPDVVIADQQTVAGALVAERLGVRWATSATTSAEFTGALDGMPKIDAWLDGLLHEVRGRIGDPDGTADPRFSPDLVLAFTTEELAGRPARAGDRIHYVGPSIAERPATTDFPWEWLDPTRPAVLITLGTANTDAGARFLTECLEAVRARAGRLQAVVVDPDEVLTRATRDIQSMPVTPHESDVLVRRYVPQLPLLQRVNAVVCHAGHNTVCETLWHGVPLVVAPIRDDQPVVAAQVVDAGAGIRVRFGRARAAAIGEALDAVLDEPRYRAAAERVGASFRAAGGATAAATHLERLATAGVPHAGASADRATASTAGHATANPGGER
ncbi:glycosyltransferase [Streptomyces iranensis]|uniref:Glycosyltransferase, MGT family n=1 Tax=Streptomyces iranensis TaxID=576784 RepID=A0A061A2T8_9ACTN|nr:glycosyltransferase [Streptomyces iranensis]MBP2060581.1 UDP:flavonoid glycosyltransferase YjiC (YdhE family) [Streptomyces iranensis]CDR16797.1 glycosyltransferase, MGT family [Streptomyces iranensis]